MNTLFLAHRDTWDPPIGGAGMTAALACLTCGAELQPSAKFCDECGSPIAVSSTPAEYKQVTVLFADVVHSMDIAAAVGAERLREIMTQLLKRSGEVVRRYGGTVDKFTDDRIMALFGAPVALRTTPFVPAWPPWPCRRRHSGLPSTSKTATASTCGCAWAELGPGDSR